MNIIESVSFHLKNEYKRLTENIIMIGSANLPFKSVLYASQLPINYNPIEGSVKNRISPGCSDCDSIEIIGRKLSSEFFNNSQEYAVNFNPLSGTQANQIIYNAILKNGDTILSFDVICGGHVSNTVFLEKYYNTIYYGIDSQEKIDYNRINILCKKHRPKLLVAGASSYPRLFDFNKLSSICKNTQTLILADIAHTGIYNSFYKESSPFGYADFISFTTHKTTRGPRGAVLYYDPTYELEIQHSIQTISQCAPRYTDIVSKTLMFSELNMLDKFDYITKIHSLTQEICTYMIEHNEIIYTGGTDIHFVVLDVSAKKLSAKQIQEKLESYGILVDVCYLPNKNYKIYTGLRIGVLMLSTLGYIQQDLSVICEVIYKTINNYYLDKSLKQLIKEIAISHSRTIEKDFFLQ